MRQIFRDRNLLKPSASNAKRWRTANVQLLMAHIVPTDTWEVILVQVSCKRTEMAANVVSGHDGREGLVILALDTEVNSSQVHQAALASVEGIHVMQRKGQRLLNGALMCEHLYRRESRK